MKALLGALQARALERVEAARGGVIPAALDLVELLPQAASAVGISAAGLHPVDARVLDVVVRLFRELRADPGLTSLQRRLLAELQLPVAAVALNEPAALLDDDARVADLLDTLLEVAVGWTHADEASFDRVYEALLGQVGRLARAERWSAEDFAAAVAVLGHVRTEDAQVSERSSRRILDDEKARLAAETTRRSVQALLAPRLARLADAEQETLVADEWVFVMYRAHQEGGPRSEAFRDACTVARVLCGEIRDFDGARLHGAISAGLESLGRAPELARNRATAAIERVLALPESEAAPQPPVESERAAAEAPRIARLPKRDALDAAGALTRGDWIELRRPGGRTVRCHLADFTSQPERCIFLNRRGMRVESLSRVDLAAANEEGRIWLVPPVRGVRQRIATSTGDVVSR